ncbi:SIMPL domain-containing protein [Kytococcus sedentarius]|uniref:SIMPL domain-containing protein n=1 Tax=Kytococcus sedentarius TaxID=1276 RepID=UPI0035BC4FF0
MQITVHGEHSLELAPEQATVRLRVEHESDAKATSLTAMRQALAVLVAELDELGQGEASPIGRRTIDPPVTHHWSEQLPDGARREHHTAVTWVTVRFDQPDALSGPVDRWGELADVQVEGVSWGLAEQTRAAREAEAIAGAVDRARQRAGAFARAAGVGEPRLVELADPGLLGGATASEGGGGHAEARMMAAQGSDSGGPAAEPAPQRISAVVHARFEAPDAPGA